MSLEEVLNVAESSCRNDMFDSSMVYIPLLVKNVSSSVSHLALHMLPALFAPRLLKAVFVYFAIDALRSWRAELFCECSLKR